MKYFYLTKQNQEYNQILADFKIENKYFTDRIKRLQPNTLDLDYLDEKVRKNLGFIDKNEMVIILDE